MIATTGIDHVHLHVGDVEAAVAFYRDVFGATEAFRVGADLVFLKLADGAVVALDGRPPSERNPAHFGLSLAPGVALDDAIAAVERAGGTVIERGEHAPGIEYAYLADRDGNVFEL